MLFFPPFMAGMFPDIFPSGIRMLFKQIFLLFCLEKKTKNKQTSVAGHRYIFLRKSLYFLSFTIDTATKHLNYTLSFFPPKHLCNFYISLSNDNISAKCFLDRALDLLIFKNCICTVFLYCIIFDHLDQMQGTGDIYFYFVYRLNILLLYCIRLF